MAQDGAQIDVQDKENQTPLTLALTLNYTKEFIVIYLKNPNMAEEEVNKMATEIEARKQAEKEVKKKAKKEAKKGRTRSKKIG